MKHLLPSGCLAMRTPLPPAPDKCKPVRKTVNMASPCACCRTCAGILTNDFVLFPTCISVEFIWSPSLVNARKIAAAFSLSLSSDIGQKASAPSLLASSLLYLTSRELRKCTAMEKTKSLTRRPTMSSTAHPLSPNFFKRPINWY